jgi:parallel beta-helix repeat protein
MVVISAFLGVASIHSTDVRAADVDGVIYDGSGGPWTLTGSPYIITGNIIVPSTRTLTIEPGVEVKFDGRYRFYVDGNLSAVGTSLNRITITSNMAIPEMGDWSRIQVNQSGHTEFKFCDISYAFQAITLQSSSGNSITYSNLSHNDYALRLSSSSDNRIENNTFWDNMDGMYFYPDAHSNVIANNTFQLTLGYAMIIESSSYTTIKDNLIDNSGGWHGGIWLWGSRMSTVKRNRFINSGIKLDGSHEDKYTTHTITTDNLVNDKPVYYYKHCNGMIIDGVVMGQLILANCDNVDVRNLQISSTRYGITLAFSKYALITRNNLSDNGVGIYLHAATYNDIIDNHFSDNGAGIHLDANSNDNTISFNNMTSNGVGAKLYYAGCRNTITYNNMTNNSYGLYLHTRSNDNVIAWNNLTDGKTGVYLYFSSDNRVISNNISSEDYDIYLERSPRTNMTDNNLAYAGVMMRGDAVLHYNTHIIPENNLVNGTPISYYKDCNGLTLNGISASQVFLANCTDGSVRNLRLNSTVVGMVVAFSTNMSITDNSLSNHMWGIFLPYSSTNNIADNYVSDSENGIYLKYSSNNLRGNNVSGNEKGILVQYSSHNNITGNNVSGNDLGIDIDQSHYNKIYHNNFFDNTKHAYVDRDTSLWNDTYPSGGNFWSDYVHPDLYSGPDQDQPGSDGIGDYPYWVKSPNKDYYPLMEPYHGDTIPPVISITSPIGGEIFTTVPILVTGTAFDIGESGLRNVEVRVKGGNWTNATGTSTWSTSLSLNPHLNVIEARAWDDSGNPSQVISVEVAYDSPDNDPPIASFIVHPSIISANATFTANASSSWDLEDPVSDLEVRWDWEDDGIWDTMWSTTKTAEHQYPHQGNYTVVLEVRDTGGLVAIDTKEVTVNPQDNHPPTCTITAPTPGSEVSGTITVEGTSADLDGTVQRVEIRIGDGSWVQVEGPLPWNYEWNTANASNGEHTVYARSYDGEDYSAEVNVTVIVSNPSEPGQGQDVLLWIAVAAIVVIAVVILAIYLLAKRRRDKDEEEPSKPPPEEPL